jgi:uncharacterized membrane protein
MKFKIYGLFIITFYLLGCTNSTLDEVSGPIIEEPALVTYQDVNPIVSQNCLACHSNPPQNGAPMSLESFSALKDAVVNRGLLDRITKPEGDSQLMPKGGPRLPQFKIDLFFAWNEDGLLEN